jgi:hypothetical protein
MQHRKGHDGVTAFLAAIPQTIDIQVFELRSVRVRPGRPRGRVPPPPRHRQAARRLAGLLSASS